MATRYTRTSPSPIDPNLLPSKHRTCLSPRLLFRSLASRLQPPLTLLLLLPTSLRPRVRQEDLRLLLGNQHGDARAQHGQPF